MESGEQRQRPRTSDTVFAATAWARPVCFVNVKSVDRIIYSIFHRFDLEWKIASSKFLHKLLDITWTTLGLAGKVPLPL